MKTASSPERTENGQDANHDWKWTPRNKKQEGLFNKAKDELHTFLAMNKEGIRLKEAFSKKQVLVPFFVIFVCDNFVYVLNTLCFVIHLGRYDVQSSCNHYSFEGDGL